MIAVTVADLLGDAFSGLGYGGMAASIGLGLVLTYRTSGVLNFAHVVMGLYGVKVYVEFRQTGDFVAPWPGLPHRWHLLENPTKTSALVAALLAAALLGYVVERLIFRPLRDAPPLSKAVASLGLLLALQQSLQLNFGGRRGVGLGRVADTDLIPAGNLNLFGVTVGRERAFLALGAVVVAALIAAALRWTRLGISVRALADSERGALLSGISTGRISSATWMLASVLSTAALILIREATGGTEDSTTASLLLIPALAAALVGQMRSLWWTTIAGLGIGLLNGLLQGWALLRSDWVNEYADWIPKAQIPAAAPAIVLLVALFSQRDVLSSRGARVELPPPVAPPLRSPAGLAVGVLVALSVALLVSPAATRQGIVISITFALMALSVVILTGFVGQVSLAPFAFAGIAAFTTAKLVNDYRWPALLAALSGLTAAVVIAIVMAIPTVRIRGMSLAVATMALATLVEQLVFSSRGFVEQSTATRIPNPSLFGHDLGFAALGSENFRPTFGIIAATTLALAVWLAGNLRNSGTGLTWIAVRTDELAAAAAAVNVPRAKALAFATAAVMAGAAGVVRGYAGPMTSQDFLTFLSLSVLGVAFVAGIGSIWGALLAGLLAPTGVLFGLGLVSDPNIAYVINGITLILITIWMPEGLTGLGRRAVTAVNRKRAAA